MLNNTAFARITNRCTKACAVALLAWSSGCATAPGSRPSIWPTKKLDGGTSATSSVSGALASTSKTVKGQFSSMSTAMSSAYGKAKTAITAPFNSAASSSSSDPTSILSKPTSIGPEMHVAQGQLFESQGNYAKALDSYSKALEIESTNPAALQSMARLYDRQNDKEKSIEFYQKAINVAPSTASTYADLGQLYARTGNLSSAKEQLQKAVNLEPKNKTYRSALAGVLLDMGNQELALEELRQVETPAMANYQMAYLHFTRNNVPVTQQYLQSALQIDPNLKPARDLMASMGGAQNLSQMAQSGRQMGQQAYGVYQQAGAIANNVQGLIPPTSDFATTNPSPAQFRTASNVSAVPANSFPSTVPALPPAQTMMR